MSNVIPLRPDEGWMGLYDGVPVRERPKIVVAGLRAAGVRAEQGKVWRGKYPTTLDLVIDIDCPWSHKSRDGMNFAKVRLLLDPHIGTLTVQSDGERGEECPTCTQGAIDRWLVTCQDHEQNGHPDHEPGWMQVGDFPDDTPDEVLNRVFADADSRGDDSPMGRIFDALNRALDGPEGVKSGGSLVEPDTEESVSSWLAEHNVPSSLGVNAAWERVKNLPGCPTQALVRRAQASRND